MSTYNKATKRKSKRELDEISIEDEPSEVMRQYLEYTKRNGTAGISGQLYETKLLTLVLLRAVKAHEDTKITNFYLATNLDGLGALDDLTFSYEMKGTRKMLFIQAKHRDNPSKRKITWKDIWSEKGEFSIFTYFDSYLEIISKFDPTSSNAIFKTEQENVEMNLIVFTTAEVDIDAEGKEFLEKLGTDDNEFLKTSDKGKIFQINCNDPGKIERLVELAYEHQMKQLAAKLVKFIFTKENIYETMMEDYMIKIFHVVLAKDVIMVSERPQGDNAEGKIRSDFHDREDFIKKFRKYFYEAAIASKKAELNLDSVAQSLETIIEDPNSENISILLGNILKFEESGKLTVRVEAKANISNEMRKSIANLKIKPNIRNEAINKAARKILESVTFKLPVNFGNLDFQATAENAQLAESLVDSIKNLQDQNVLKIISIDTITTPPQSEKVKNNSGLFGLVGNVLIYDDETDLLKFNEEQAVSENARKFIETLQNQIKVDDQIKLETVRFKVNIKNFPVDSFQSVKNVLCRNLIIDFLSKFKFYTNQSKQNEVEDITKNELINFEVLSSNLQLPIENEHMYIVLHKEIQNWWKQPNGYYLTENSKILNDAPKLICPRPHLYVSNSSYLSNVNYLEIKFMEESVEPLKLEICKFIKNSNQQYLNIVTNVKRLTAIKLLQCFDKVETQNSFYFIDFECVCKRGWFMHIINEINKEEGVTLVIDCGKQVDIRILSGLKKAILLTCKESQKMSETNIFEKYREIEDKKIGFLNLDLNSQHKLLNESKVIFQDRELPLGDVVDDDAKSFISGEILLKFLNGDCVEIDKEVANLDTNIEPYYITRNFKLHIETFRELDRSIAKDSEELRDGDDYEASSYDDAGNSWILEDQFIDDFVHKDGSNVTVISAEPGMGKSTVLTHMALLLKEDRSCPLLWLVRINLNDHTQLLKYLKFSEENNDQDDFRKVTDFLLKTLHLKTEFETKLFERNLRPNSKVNVILFADGFDEISPNYGPQTQRLLEIISKGKAARILVTTRPYSFVDELENKLDARLFKLEGLVESDQLNYLERFWKGTLESKELYAKYTRKFKSILDKQLEDEFLNNPLHLKLIAEYTKDEFERFCKGRSVNFKIKINLMSLYKTIIEKKYYDIFVGEKKRLDQSNIAVQLDEDKLYKEFLDEHNILALHSLFDGETFQEITSKEIDQMKLSKLLVEFESGKKKAGIITTVIDGRARFIHRNIAEYFAGIYFANKFRAIRESEPFPDMEKKFVYLLRGFGRQIIIKQIKLFVVIPSELAYYLFENLIQLNGSEYFQKKFPKFDDHTKVLMLIIAYATEHKPLFKFLLKEIDMGIIQGVFNGLPISFHKSIKLHDVNDIFSTSTFEYNIWKRSLIQNCLDVHDYLRARSSLISLTEFLKSRQINLDYQSAWNKITNCFLEDVTTNVLFERKPSDWKWKWKIYFKGLLIRNLDLNGLENLRVKEEHFEYGVPTWELIEGDSELSKETDLKEIFFKCRDLFDHLKNECNENFIILFNELKPNYIGVLINARDVYGRALIDQAVELKNEEIFNLLKDSGAKCNFESIRGINKFFRISTEFCEHLEMPS